MKMEVGKRYRTNDGTVWDCISLHPDQSRYSIKTNCDYSEGLAETIWYASESGWAGPDEMGEQLMEMTEDDPKEYTGGSVNYYRVPIKSPTSGGDPYEAECNDIIEALKMNYAEGNAFKAIWRSCAARKLGLAKKFYDDGLYDAEKVVFFGGRMVVQAKEK